MRQARPDSISISRCCRGDGFAEDHIHQIAHGTACPNVDPLAPANLKQRIADGVADALNHRITPWLKATEKVESINENENDPIASATQLIAQQESLDKRFGTRSSISREIINNNTLFFTI